jgi:hypothetical protein
MEVSDPSGSSWDGVEIQEKLKLSKNECGARARKHACKTKAECRAASRWRRLKHIG